MVIAVVSVVITTYIIWFVLSLLASYHRAQRALHWWYRRQSMRMSQEGEAIWDRMLQELFIVRRHLELSSFLSMPEAKGGYTKTPDIGLQLLKKLMQCYPSLNIVVQTAHPRCLIRLKLTISDHEGGFTVADKSLPMDEMLTRVEWALKGAHCTPKDIRSRLEVKSEWLEMLQLAFKEELQDKAIGERMNVAERTVRHYWKKIQDALGVYPDAHKNLRIQTEKRAREEGLID